MSAFIGGNLEEITAAAKRIKQAAAMAETTRDDSSGAAGELKDAIDVAMSSLTTKFNTAADEMKSDVDAAHAQLDSANWQGASRENALAIKSEMQSKISTVLGEAKVAIGEEQIAFNNRADAVVSSIDNEFKFVMNDVFDKFNQLAEASDQTRINLEQADQTIGIK